MNDYYKYNRKRDYSIDLRERFVRTMSGQIPNDESIEVRLPAWMKEKMIAAVGKKNVSEYVRTRILADFVERGIQEPVTDEDRERFTLQMINFP